MKKLPPRLSTKNLQRYAHTQTFNRLAGNRKLRGLRYRDRIAGEKLAWVMGAFLLVYLLVGGFYTIF